MDGRIAFTCASTHDGEDCGRDGPTITLVATLWAFCARAGVAHHDWRRLDGMGMTLQELKVAALTHRRLIDSAKTTKSH